MVHLNKISEYLNSNEGKDLLNKYFEDIKNNNIRRERYCNYLNNLTKLERNILFDKIIKKYNSKKYNEREYSMGYEPRKELYNIIFEYSKKFQIDITEEEKEKDEYSFLVGAYKIDETYKIFLYVGQGAFIAMEKIK